MKDALPGIMLGILFIILVVLRKIDAHYDKRDKHQ